MAEHVFLSRVFQVSNRRRPGLVLANSLEVIRQDKSWPTIRLHNLLASGVRR